MDDKEIRNAVKGIMQGVDYLGERLQSELKKANEMAGNDDLTSEEKKKVEETFGNSPFMQQVKYAQKKRDEAAEHINKTFGKWQ